MTTRSLVITAALAAVSMTGTAALGATMGPVTTMKDPTLGSVLSTRGSKALYVWNKERAGMVKCVGSCAKLWPPLIVSSKKAVPMHVNGVMGEFGTVRRPDGRLQVTYNRRPLYSFKNDPKGVAKCNNVNGWFAVKAR